MQLEDPIADTPSEVYRAFHEYFEFVPADTSDLLDEVFALRYQVYCVERSFEDAAKHPSGREKDEYDTRAVHTLIRHKRTGYCAAAVRLVLADNQQPAAPFPLESACAGSLDADAQSSIATLDRLKVAEISRFAVSKEYRRRLGEAETISGVSAHAVYRDEQEQGNRRRGFPHITLGLIAACVQMAAKEGITHWFAVMEPTLLRFLQRFGIHFSPIGPLVDHHGLRLPTVGTPAAVATGIRNKRPDVWEIVTDRGRIVPCAPKGNGWLK